MRPRKAPRRMVCINTPLGLHPAALLSREGRQGLRALAVPGGPQGFPRRLHGHLGPVASRRSGPATIRIYSFLTAAPHPERRAGFKNSISLDQFAAEHLHGQTRFASLPLSCEGFGLSWTRSGAPRAVGVLAVERVRQAVPRRPARRGRGAEARRLAGRPEHPRRGPRPGEDDAGGPRARAIARSSTSTSPASANWNSGWRRPRRGRRSRSPRWTPSRRRTSPNATDLIGQDAAVVRPDPPGVADRFDAAGHAATAGHQPRAADPGRVARAITTCRTTARTRARSSSSRSSRSRR